MLVLLFGILRRLDPLALVRGLLSLNSPTSEELEQARSLSVAGT